VAFIVVVTTTLPTLTGGRHGRVGQSAPTIALPLKLGHEWYVVARHRSGQQEHVRRFKTETEAKSSIARSRKLGSKNGLRVVQPVS
jgi:hypothetical protein